MANLVPEFISVLRDIRDIKYPDIITRHNDIITRQANVVSYDTLYQSYVASSLANANATALDKIATNADVVLTHADVVLTHADVAKTAQDAITCTEKAVIAQKVLDMTASASTLTAGSPASASYNPTTGIMSFGIPTGPKGDKGDAFVVNALGTLVGRDAYDLQPANFTYYATDVGLIYFKLSATSGDWSVGSPFGKGDTGDTGNGIASITLTGTVGAVDTYRILYTDATFFDFDVTNGSVTSVAGKTGDVTLVKGDVGLGNVDNTSDANKPVSTAQQTALDLKADQTTTYTKTETDAQISNRMSGFKNVIINPAFEINQYADIDTAPVAMANNIYRIDRFADYISAVTGTIQRLPKSLVNGKYVRSVKCTATSTASGWLGLTQKSELFYNGETKTFGVWVKSNSTNARLVVYDGIGSSISSAHSGGGGWEFLTVTRTINAGATVLAMYVTILSATGVAVSITSGDYIESTMWQLEDGSVATKFEQRPVGLELDLCKRYYQAYSPLSIQVVQYSTNNVTFYYVLVLAIKMRVAPSVSSSAFNPTSLTGSPRLVGTGTYTFTSAVDNVRVQLSLDAADTDVAGSVYLANLVLNAEL